MSKYDEAKQIAKELVDLEKVRKETQEKIKGLKEELLSLCENEDIETKFEFQDGLVYLDTKITYKPADGLKEETEVKSKSPEKLSQDFIESYFIPDLKLSKIAKQAISEGDTELLSVLAEIEKSSIKIVVN